LTVVGGGVVGDGREVEDSLGLSFLGGILPENSSVNLFSLTDNSQEINGYDMASLISNPIGDLAHATRKPSHLVFADPHCHQIHSMLDHTEGLVAGGISVARPNQPSLAIGTKVLPPGSLIGATFAGNIGLEVVVTQGCRPVGSTYRVTGVDGPAVHELDSERAIDRLQQTIDQVMKDGGIDSIAVKCDDFLGGIHKATEETTNPENGQGKTPDYFILRQMTGFRPRSGAILVCGPQIQPGDFFRFHVQSKEIALGDWQATLKRAQTERLFLGQQAGKALGAFQISCMGRGQNLFGIPNVDLRHIETLLPPNTPIAGLMANAEIGPVGIRMGISEKSKSVLHGFASVVAMLCDYSDSLSHQEMELSCLGNATGTDAWE
jgi:small ligand-binding sensory domain FIST